jgi:hypothetical protein
MVVRGRYWGEDVEEEIMIDYFLYTDTHLHWTGCSSSSFAVLHL